MLKVRSTAKCHIVTVLLLARHSGIDLEYACSNELAPTNLGICINVITLSKS